MTETKHLSDLEIEALLDDALEGGAAREARGPPAPRGAGPRGDPVFPCRGLPTIPGLEMGFSEKLATQAEGLLLAGEAALQPLLDSADAWLRMAPQWGTLSPALVAGAS